MVRRHLFFASRSANSAIIIRIPSAGNKRALLYVPYQFRRFLGDFPHILVQQVHR
jgi:hypothetical protein